jgi:hypothetical protein
VMSVPTLFATQLYIIYTAYTENLMKEMVQQNTVSSFLVQKLYDLGVRHVFGVAGEYVLVLSIY